MERTTVDKSSSKNGDGAAVLESADCAYTAPELAEAITALLMEADDRTPGVVDYFAKTSTRRRYVTESEVKKAAVGVGEQAEAILSEHIESESERIRIYE